MAITASILVDTLQGGGGLGCILSQSLKHATSIYIFWQIVLFSAVIGIASYYGISLIERIFNPADAVILPVPITVGAAVGFGVGVVDVICTYCPRTYPVLPLYVTLYQLEEESNTVTEAPNGIETNMP